MSTLALNRVRAFGSTNISIHLIRSFFLGGGDKTFFASPVPNSAFSTGHVAYRDTYMGGWFIQVLTDMIEKYARTKDIEEIMTEVSNDACTVCILLYLIPKVFKTGFYCTQVSKELAPTRNTSTVSTLI